MTPAEIIKIVGAVGKVLDILGGISTPELLQKVTRYFVEMGHMPREE